MALLNEILGVASRFNAALTRKFQITGGAPAPQLTPEIVPTMEFGEDPADLILQGERLMGGVVVIPAVALKSGVARLRNPPNSQYALIIDRIWYCNTAGPDFPIITLQDAGSDLAQLPSVPGIMSRDTRVQQSAAASIPGKGAGVLSFDQSPPGTIGAGLFQGVILQNTELVYDQPIVLGPNSFCDVESAAANQQVIVSFAWRERPLTLSELGPF